MPSLDKTNLICTIYFVLHLSGECGQAFASSIAQVAVGGFRLMGRSSSITSKKFSGLALPRVCGLKVLTRPFSGGS